MTTPHENERGFTLVEALVCLGLLSMMAVMLLGGVTSATLLARGDRRADMALDDVAAVQTVLRDRLLMLRPVPQLNSGQPLMDFGGRDTAIEFYSAPAAGNPEPGNQKYRLMLSNSGDLILYRAQELTDRINLSERTVVGWRPVTLLRGVSSLSFAYFGATPASPERKWRSTWEDVPTLPELIRVRVTFAPGDVRNWPDLVVRPGPTVDLSCNPETSSTRCGKGQKRT